MALVKKAELEARPIGTPEQHHSATDEGWTGGGGGRGEFSASSFYTTVTTHIPGADLDEVFPSARRRELPENLLSIHVVIFSSAEQHFISLGFFHPPLSPSFSPSVALPLPCVCLANSLFHYSQLTPVPRSLAFVRNEFPWCCCVVAVRCGVHTGGLLFRKLFAMFLSAAVADSAPLMLCVFPWNRCSCQRETLIGVQLKTAKTWPSLWR